MFPGTGHGHIQLSVDQLSILLKNVVCQEIQLIPLLDSEAIQDVISLTALVTLDGVDSNLEQ